MIVFLTDDQRTDTLEVMPRTGRWFLDGGTQFTNAYVTTPLCCPSRASIFTGRYVHNHGVTDNFSAMELDQRSTLQRYLQEAGYLTAIAGKFLNEWDLSFDPPYFDRWSIFRDHLSYNDVDFNVEGTTQLVDGYSTSFVELQALRYLNEFERADERPWLMYVTPLAPHKPFTPEPRYASAPVPSQEPNPAVLEQDLTDKPSFVQNRELGQAGARLIRRQQLRTLMSTDDVVGQVMTELRLLGELQGTLAFFLSDNGFLAGEHGLVDKRLPYRQSAHIPFLVRWDDHVDAGSEDGRLVANVDLVPTVLSAAGITPSGRYPLDGRDLMDRGARSHLFMEYFFDPVRPVPEWAAIRTLDFLYVEYYSSPNSVIFRELYDTAADPWELQNVLGDGIGPNDPPAAVLSQLSGMVERGRQCRGRRGVGRCS